MASFKHFSRTLLGFSLLTMGSMLTEACGVQSDSLSAPEASRVEDNSASTSGSTSGGNEGEGVVLPSPPEDQAGGSSFVNLCGGGCMTGDKTISCTLPTGPDNPPSTSCQIVPTETGPVAECRSPGSFQDGEPCESASDCAAGLGCVRTDSNVAVCRAYCCGDLEGCGAGTYCTRSAIAEDTIHPVPIQIPVCVPAITCTLLDDTTCPEKRTCTLVREDGTTSCVEPGAGKEGSGCPCAAGHVCVLSSNSCRALCRVGGNDCPSGMLCQGGSLGFPAGIGLCVK